MNLPAELRLMILEYVVAPKGEVNPWNKLFVSRHDSNATTTARENSHIALDIG